MLAENTKIGKTVEKRIKNRIIYSVCLVVLGAASVILGMGGFLPVELSDYLSGFYSGVGTGLIAAGIITIIRNIRTLKNKKLLKEKEIYENDERNKMIGLKTWSYTGYAMFIILYAGLLVAGFISELVLNTILVILGVYALCLFFAGLYCKKTM